MQKNAFTGKSEMEELVEIVSKIMMVNPLPVKIEVSSKKIGLIDYIRDLKMVPDKKTQFSLSHGSYIIMEAEFSMDDTGNAQLFLDTSRVSTTRKDPKEALCHLFYSEIKSLYFVFLYEKYIKQNDLIEIEKEIKILFDELANQITFLELNKAEETFSKIKEVAEPHKNKTLFFKEIEGRVTKKSYSFEILKSVSDPNMDIIERISLCKEPRAKRFFVIPGEGKKFLAIVCTVGSLARDQIEQAQNVLSEMGFGGSIILYGMFGHSIDLFLIKERKVGMMVHNAAIHHESKFEEVLEEPLTEEDKKFCRSLPHNTLGDGDVIYYLTKESLLKEITIFL